MIINDSVLSFPDRGKWGKSSYRGNTSGWIVKGFLERWHKDPLQIFVDPTEGGGTSREVAAEMKIRYMGFDLRKGFDILHHDLLSQLGDHALTAFCHFPYKDMIDYEGGPNDLSHFSKLEEFLEMASLALNNVYRALRPGGFYGILMGNMRKAGKFYPLSSYMEMLAPGEEVVQMVKLQHNTTSGNNSYYNTNSFVPTMHEMFYVFSKPDTLVFALDVAIQKEEQRAIFSQGTWRNIVRAVCMQYPGPMSLEQLYKRIEGTPKAQQNKYWKEKVRQVVQLPEFQRISRGVYQPSIV